MENDMALQKIKLKIGTVYQKEPNGVYYFRYQVNGARKAVSLKTRNKQQAIKEAEKYVPLLQATSSEVIAAHVQHARNLATPEKNLFLYQAWDEYEKSPDRATPATVSEALAYKSTFEEFVKWVNDPQATLRSITETTAMQYADYMRQQNIAVSTHNRKLKRIRKVFNASALSSPTRKCRPVACFVPASPPRKSVSSPTSPLPPSTCARPPSARRLGQKKERILWRL